MATKLKIAGTWSGQLEVELDQWTIPMLREEVAKRSNMLPEVINLISAGKILKDGDGCQKLCQLGIKNNSKILATRTSVEEGKSLKNELMAEVERSRRFTRIKEAATALVNRHSDGSLPIEDFNIELEDQNGKKIRFGSETDQRAIMMGLILSANAKRLMKKQMYKDALEVLTMGEFVDNVPILQIDIVWCYFMLQDISWLSMAGIRLAKAREGIERAHGKDSSRVRLLQAGCHPELALRLRMELLEGVVAYHSGQFDICRKALISAQTKFFQLQVSDESLSMVLSMGFNEHDAKRALRLCNQDVGSAIDFLFIEKERRTQQREEDERRRREIKEQKQYGMTPMKKAVDLQRLNELVSNGFEKELAAEALRRNENDTVKALIDLTNQETNSALQLDIESRKRTRYRQATDELLRLLTDSGSNPPTSANNNTSSPFSVPNNAGTSSLIENNNVESDESSLIDDINVEGTSTAGDTTERDVEMEDELAKELTGDVFSDYDIDVTKEGEAINEYLALLDSAAGIQQASFSQ